MITEAKKVTVYCTKDYDMFKKIVGNRELDEKNILAIMESYGKDYHAMSRKPIEITRRNGILDGQHRLEAARRKGYPVYFIIVEIQEHEELEYIEKVQTAKKWCYRDNQNKFVKFGKSEYLILEQFCQHYKIPYGIGVALLSGDGVNAGNRNLKSHKSGTFVASSLPKATLIMEYTQDFQGFFKDGYKHRPFIRAMQQIVYSGNYCHERMTSKFGAIGVPKLEKYSSAMKYMEKLEAIYNYHERRANRKHLVPAR